MSKNAEYLERYGWKRISRKKRGMFMIERWWNPRLPEAQYSQDMALMLERQFQKFKKQTVNNEETTKT